MNASILQANVANRVDPYEMPVAFHLGLHCLPLSTLNLWSSTIQRLGKETAGCFTLICFHAFLCVSKIVDVLVSLPMGAQWVSDR